MNDKMIAHIHNASMWFGWHKHNVTVRMAKIIDKLFSGGKLLCWVECPLKVDSQFKGFIVKITSSMKKVISFLHVFANISILYNLLCLLIEFFLFPKCSTYFTVLFLWKMSQS